MSQPRDPYAPPKETTSRLEMPIWTIDGVFRAAYRQFRAQPVAALIALGVIPQLWSLPGAWGRKLGITWLAKNGRDDVASSIGVGAVGALWGAVIAGGTVLIALDLARGAKVDWTRYRDGLRAIPAMFAIDMVLPTAADVYNRVFEATRDEGQIFGVPKIVLLSSATALAFGVLYFCFRWSLAIYPAAERRMGLLGALGWSHELTGRAQLRYFALLLAVMLIMAPFTLAGILLPVPLSGVALVVVMPLISLAFANVVVAFEPQRS